MRNYAGHRLAPWLAHVMVSRQETARPLLTPGEVMQLPPSDELVLISGLAPIRAQKLRYYEDRNFIARVAPPPTLADGIYADRPKARSNDWGSFARKPDARLGRVEDAAETEAEVGGLQQERHPGLAEDTAPKREEPTQLDLLAVDQEETDPATDQKAMDRARGLSAVARGYGINESSGRDLLPGL
jgi:type IV secretion system protein VirD4